MEALARLGGGGSGREVRVCVELCGGFSFSFLFHPHVAEGAVCGGGCRVCRALVRLNVCLEPGGRN